jgi:PAS domain S-box-containing protein
MSSGRSRPPQEVLRNLPRRLFETFQQRAHELAKVGTYLLDLTTRQVLISPEMAYLLRIGETWIEMPLGEFRDRFYLPEDRDAVQAKAEHSYATEGKAVLESRIVRGDGEVIWLRASSSVERNERGEPIAVGVVQDVTESAVTIQQLQATEARFRALIDGAPMAIGVGRNGRTLWVNPTYRTMFGLTDDLDVQGQAVSDQIAPASAAMVTEYLRRRSRGEHTPDSYEMVCRRFDGSTFPAHTTVTTIALPDGPATVAFVTDLTDLKRAEADLALESSVQAALHSCLQGLPPEANAEQSAQAISDALFAIPGVDFAAVLEFSSPDTTLSLAHRAPPGFAAALLEPGGRNNQLRALASAGAGASYWTPLPDEGAWGHALTAIGLQAVAVGPIFYGDEIEGAIVLGTCDPAFARTIVERWPAVVDLSSTPSAMLAERLHARREQAATRSAVLEVISRRAFRSVFQPVIDLATSEAAGFEALVRFDSRQRPDQCFADARRVGAGVALELAILEDAIDAGRQLPAGLPLHLNASPAVLTNPGPVRELFSRADRPIVLEVTEHDVIQDYAAFRNVVATLGGNIRIAVDDAGAGIANFAHIVELHPDLVKIDIGLVRGVNVDPGRQALVIAMGHFARVSGCQVIAEGIETPEEAAMLRSLGVMFGQGFLFGTPQPADAFGSAA